jgi:hypothetical protein
MKRSRTGIDRERGVHPSKAASSRSSMRRLINE